MFVISAGHHPNDPGAINTSDSTFTEYSQTVLWVDCLASYLTQKGVGYVKVPSTTLKEKIRFINKLTDNIICAIEIHFNSSSSPSASGCETLYCPGSVKGLHYASMFQKIMAKHIRPDRGFKEGWFRGDKPGHVDYVGDVDGDEHVDAFLSQTKPTALILEPEFIHNKYNIVLKMEDVCKGLAGLMDEMSKTI